MGHFRNWCLNKIFTCLHYFMGTCFKESSAKALSAFLPTGFLFSQVGDCTRLYSEEETLQFPLLFISSLTALQLLQYSVQTWSCTSLNQMRKYENMKILHDLNGVFLLDLSPSILPLLHTFLTNINISDTHQHCHSDQYRQHRPDCLPHIYVLHMIYSIHSLLCPLKFVIVNHNREELGKIHIFHS